MFVESSKSTERFVSNFIKQTRSVTDAREWIRTQTADQEAMKHINEIWNAVFDTAALERQLFWMPHADSPEPSDELVAEENLMAEECACQCSALVFRRLRRTLSITIGWPDGFARMLRENTVDVKRRAVTRFYLDYTNFRKIDESHLVQDIVNRHLFQTMTNQQMKEALVESKGELTEPIHIHLDLKHLFTWPNDWQIAANFVGIAFGLIGIEMAGTHANEVYKPQHTFPKPKECPCGASSVKTVVDIICESLQICL